MCRLARLTLYENLFIEEVKKRPLSTLTGQSVLTGSNKEGFDCMIQDKHNLIIIEA